MFSLIIPTYNEKDNIKPLLDAVTDVLKVVDYEILVVDDDSPDGTASEVLNYHYSNNRVRVIVRKKARGLSSAVIAGFDKARGDVLGVMDADLSHDPEILLELIKCVQGDYEMAVGTRSSVNGWGLKRKLISQGACTLARAFLGVSISDPMSGYFVIRKSVFDRVKDSINPIGYKIMLELYARAMPLSVAEVPYVFENRAIGESKLSNKVMKDYLAQLFSLRSSLNKVED
ncbi:MAG: polyprenol monophosphomannose synthase [Candidatus Nanoarchaeia archaeon]|jgi:dolichol-phosphate mannosyltransferase